MYDNLLLVFLFSPKENLEFFPFSFSREFLRLLDYGRRGL
jgi:hypothetical protein